MIAINNTLDVVTAFGVGVMATLLVGGIALGVNSRIPRDPKPARRARVEPLDAELVDDEEEIPA